MLNVLFETFSVALHFIYYVMIQKAIKRKLISVQSVSLGSFSKVKNFKQQVVLGFFYFFLLIKISKTLLRTDCTFMMTHAFRSDFFDVAARLRDDSQRRFLAQHSVATLLRHGFEQLQYCSNIATLCCAKNRLCKSSRVTSP